MLKRYPFTRQENLKDCGAASLSMIIKYYKGYIPLEKISEMLKTTKNGTTAYHIIEALKQIGFEAKGFRVKQLENTRVPFIANVQINSYNHFLVVYEVTERYVLVADPACGIKKQDRQEFLKIWTNIKIVMHPVKQIPRYEKVSLKVLKNIIKPHKKIILKLFVLSCVITLSTIFSSFFFQSLLENLKTNKYKEIFLCFIFAFSYFISIIFDYIRGKMALFLSFKIEASITLDSVKKIILLPYNYYHNHTSGEILSKVDDLKIVKEMVSKVLLTVLIDFPLSLITGIILFLLNKTLFLIVQVIVIFYVIIILVYNKPLKRCLDASLESKILLASKLEESIRGFETIKGLNIEDKMINQIIEANNQYMKNALILVKKINGQTFFKNFISMIGNILIFMVGVMLVRYGFISVEALITYILLISLYLNPLRNIIDLDATLKESSITIRKVLELISVSFSKKKGGYKHGDIVFKNVSYSFDDVKNVLDNVNLEIKQNEKVFITGKSGSGKSTLMKLLKGYYDGYKGGIYVDNVDIRGMNLRINYVSLNESLFTGTVNYNLKIKGNKNLKQVKKICQTSWIDEGVLNYNALIEENGLNLSYGQRQKIALARALQDFDILIIDEALSALDIASERGILKSLLKYCENKTVIFISHRLENKDLFDSHIVFDNGRIVKKEEIC